MCFQASKQAIMQEAKIVEVDSQQLQKMCNNYFFLCFIFIEDLLEKGTQLMIIFSLAFRTYNHSFIGL